eukprot:m51a1_g6666 hypothetical protein (732) ;mRNA; f:178689-181003
MPRAHHAIADASSASAVTRRGKVSVPVYVVMLALVTGTLTLVTVGTITTTVSATDKSLRHAAVQRSSVLSEEIASVVNQKLISVESVSHMLATALSTSQLDPVGDPAQFERFLLLLAVSHQRDTSGVVLVERSWDPEVILLTGMSAMGPPGSGAPYMMWRTNRTSLLHCAWAVNPHAGFILFPMYCDIAKPNGLLPYWGENLSASVAGSWCPVFPAGNTGVYVDFRVSTFNESTGEWIGYSAADLSVLGLNEILLGTEYVDGIAFIVERNTSNFLGSTDPAVNSTFVSAGGIILPLPVSSIASAMVEAADRAVRQRFGSWALVEQTSFWIDSELLVSCSLIDRRGLAWVSVSVTRPKLSGLQWETIVVSVAIWLAGAVIAGLVSLLISVPVRNLAKDMTSVCSLQFSGLRTRHSTESRIAEMHVMQDSFLSLKTAMEALSKYIPPPVVLSIMQSRSGRIERFMKTKFLGILFVDLQGFTSLSESVPLSTLNHVLNTWFEELGQVIDNNNGTIDKFIGDAILVLFGAPEDIVDPAGAACQTAMEMTQSMMVVNELASKLELAPLKCRVGIHCGPVLVGNIGSHTRINYTMEQLGKEYGITPLVSGSIAQRVSDKYVCVFLDIVSLRGKTHLTRVYHLACASNLAPAETLAIQSAFVNIHDCSSNGKTDEALSLVAECLANSSYKAYYQALRVLKRRIECGELKSSVYSASTDTSLDQLSRVLEKKSLGPGGM